MERGLGSRSFTGAVARMEVGSGARMTPWLWSEEGDALDDERRERGRGRFQGEATEFGFRRCEFELFVQPVAGAGRQAREACAVQGQGQGCWWSMRGPWHATGC